MGNFSSVRKHTVEFQPVEVKVYSRVDITHLFSGHHQYYATARRKACLWAKFKSVAMDTASLELIWPRVGTA